MAARGRSRRPRKLAPIRKKSPSQAKEPAIKTVADRKKEIYEVLKARELSESRKANRLGRLVKKLCEAAFREAREIYLSAQPPNPQPAYTKPLIDALRILRELQDSKIVIENRSLFERIEHAIEFVIAMQNPENLRERIIFGKGKREGRLKTSKEIIEKLRAILASEKISESQLTDVKSLVSNLVWRRSREAARLYMQGVPYEDSLREVLAILRKFQKLEPVKRNRELRKWFIKQDGFLVALCNPERMKRWVEERIR
ncbi:MAG: hypothetical protein J7L44_03850 [Candidatus Diapherotrites archaeon]|nr:hypothetical protein [Candidatus Diapherotrites archaeon]